MNKSIAVAKEADAKKSFSSARRNDKSIQLVRDESERQLNSLGGVIGNIRRDGTALSAESIATELGSRSAAERAPALLALQQTQGNRYVQRVVAGIQAKLVVGQPGDKYEHEADRVADEVMRMPESQVQRQVEPEDEEEETLQSKPLADQITPLVQVQRQEEPEEEETLQSKPLAKEITPLVQRQVDPEEEEEELQAKLAANAEYPIQRQVEEEDLVQTKPLVDQITPLVQRPVEEEEEEILQTKRGEDTTSEVTHNLESQIQMIRGGGKPLSESERIYFEPRFGVNFDPVRVHTDSQAADSARAVNARAFTVGRDVVFGAGQYASGTSEGRRLMAHELTHVVQQSSACQHSRVQLKAIRGKTYTVQKGERLEDIADKLGVIVEDLMATNFSKLKTWTTPSGKKIRGFNVGEKIIIPAAKEKRDERVEWKHVKENKGEETPSKAAKQPGFSLYENILKPLGQKLKWLADKLGWGPEAPMKLSTSEGKTSTTKTEVENQVKNTLKVAIDLEKNLRKKHPDYAEKGGFQGYGTKKDDQYVCTTFAQEVLRRAGYKISGKVSAKINITIKWKTETGKKKPSKKQIQEALAKLVEANDPRIKGVVNALVSSDQGIEITAEQLKPGDFVQYWYQSKKGVGGHVVQVVKVIIPGKKILAHGSHGSKRGVGTITVYLKSKKMKRVFCVRPKQPLT